MNEVAKAANEVNVAIAHRELDRMHSEDDLQPLKAADIEDDTEGEES